MRIVLYVRDQVRRLEYAGSLGTLGAAVQEVPDLPAVLVSRGEALVIDDSDEGDINEIRQFTEEAGIDLFVASDGRLPRELLERLSKRHESGPRLRDQSPAQARSQREASRIIMIARPGDIAKPLLMALREAGFSDLELVTDARKALPAFYQMQPDAVILDAEIEEIDALSLMKQLSARVPTENVLPFVVFSPTRAPQLRQKALEAGLTAFFEDATDPRDVILLVRELIGIRARGFRIAREAQRRIAEFERNELDMVLQMARFAEVKDHPGTGHVARVGELSAEIASALGMSREAADAVGLAAQLHDIGKIGIPDMILRKQAPLALEDMDIVKRHTSIGASLLMGSTSPLLRMAEEIALYHHENWNGTGYTPGLEGESIPLVGRIVRVSDAFDAMTMNRPFAEQWRLDNALEFIRSQAGQSYDPSVVAAFLDVQAARSKRQGSGHSAA